MARNLLICFFLVQTLISVRSQDPQFTQFYSAPLYLAPSFAGATVQHRVATSIRNQWPSIPQGFLTYAFSYDHYFANFNSGVGVLVFRDQAGSGNLNNTAVGVCYSYDFNISRTWHIRPGAAFYYNMWGIDFHRLTFGDMLEGDGSGSSIENSPVKDFTGDVDFATSVLVYTNRFWSGFSIDHLLRPNQSFYYEKSRVPFKYQVFGGYQMVKFGRLLKPIDETISFAYLYKRQGQDNQLDMGLYWNKYPMVLGFWYRGIPILNSPRGDMLAFLVGFKMSGLSIGYSYDFTISHLVGNTSGAHELSLIYQFKTKIKKKMHSIPCPEF